MARVLAGDVDAFEGIVRRWQGRLLALALRMCRDRGRAEDMTQEGFVRIFRSLGQWRGRASFSTWLTSVALNAFRSHLRLRPWVARQLELELEELVPSPSAGDEDPRAERVRRAVAALPALYRDALLAFYFQDQDLEQAARTLGVPAGTLKARLHRGRKLVEDALRKPR